MPSPPREFPIPAELYSDYVVTDPFEDLWPLLDQEAPPEANDHVATNSTFLPMDLQVVSQNVDPWFLRQQESGVSIPPLLLEHDDFANINAALIDQDIAVAGAYDNFDQVNPESLILPPSDPILLVAQESACNSRAEKGKGKLEKESPSKRKKRGEKLKSQQIPNDYDIDQLLDDELPGTERLDQGGSVIAKKENHNAKERVRRLKLNASYLALGALLPQPRRSKKRWTAPSIIDKMVHYIPELKTEIEELINKKDELDAVNKSSIRDKTGDEDNIELDSTTVSVHEVSGREELIIQVCIKMKQGNEEDNTFSYLVRNLELEELLLLGASINNVGIDRVCYNLHLQMRGSCSSSHSHGSNNTAAAFKEKVVSWLRSYTTH